MLWVLSIFYAKKRKQRAPAANAQKNCGPCRLPFPLALVPDVGFHKVSFQRTHDLVFDTMLAQPISFVKHFLRISRIPPAFSAFSPCCIPGPAKKNAGIAFRTPGAFLRPARQPRTGPCICLLPAATSGLPAARCFFCHASFMLPQSGRCFRSLPSDRCLPECALRSRPAQAR